MSLFHDGRDTCFTEDAPSTRNQSSKKDSLQGGMEGKGRAHTVFTPLNPLGRQKKNSTTICPGREKCTTRENGSLIRTPSTGSTWRRHKKRISVLADKVSRRCCSRSSAGRLHRKSGIPGRRQNFVSKTLHASARSKDNSQRCLQIKTATATAAKTGHIEEYRETCSGAEPWRPKEHRETCCG